MFRTYFRILLPGSAFLLLFCACNLEALPPRPVTAAAPAQTAASKSRAQPNLVTTKIDFVPGEKTIFFDDFHDMPPGEPPPHWQVRGGKIELRMGGGIRELAVPYGTELASPSLKIPANFTLQVTMVLRHACTWSVRNKDDEAVLGITSDHWENNSGVTVEVDGPNGELGKGFEKADVSKPVELALWAQQGRIRAYVNGARTVDVNNVKLGPVDHLHFSQDNVNSGSKWVGLRSVRLAESASDPGLVLATTGKYVTHGIYFDTDSATLKPASAGVIKEISTALYKHPDMKLEIDGYTDSTGNAAHNVDLSNRRAEAVMKVLVSQFGIDQSRLTANGDGDANPIASNNTAEGRAQNRRVEFVKK